MTHVKVLIGGVFLAGEALAKDHVVKVEEIGEKNARSLVEGNIASYCDEQGVEVKDTGQAEATQQADPTLEVDRLRSALDSQYKADELKEAAKNAGVEFPYDATKGAVIQAILDQGKADELTK